MLCYKKPKQNVIVSPHFSAFTFFFPFFLLRHPVDRHDFTCQGYTATSCQPAYAVRRGQDFYFFLNDVGAHRDFILYQWLKAMHFKNAQFTIQLKHEPKC